MKIGIVLNYSLAGSGSGTYVLGLARALADLRHEVVVISRDSPAPVEEQLQSLDYSGPYWDQAGIKHYTLTFRPYLAIPTHTDLQVDGYFADCSAAALELYLAHSINALSDISLHEQFDVLHVNHVVPLPYVAARVRLRLQIPFVVTLHGSHITYVLDVDPGRYRQYATEGLAAAARIIVTTHAVRRRCQRHVNLDSARFSMIPVGVDTRAFAPSHTRNGDAGRALEALPLLFTPEVDAPTAVFVGKIIPDKGAHLLPLIMAVAKQHNPRSQLVVVGGGALLSTLAAIAREEVPINSVFPFLGDSHLAPVEEFFASPSGRAAWETMGRQALAATSFLGFQPRDTLTEILGSAEACLFPSLTEEALPMTALEALSSGTLPIAEETSGFTELMRRIRSVVPGAETALRHLDRSSGLSLVERYGRAAAMTLTVGDEDGAKAALRGGLRQLATSEYDWSAIARRIVSVYEEAVE